MHVSRKNPCSVTRYLLTALLATIALMNTRCASLAPSSNAPVIKVQPTTQIALIGTNPYFSVSATNGSSLSYQWKKNGAAIDGATSPELDFKNATAAASGNYSVTVSSDTGSVTSKVARLYMVAPATDHPPVLPTIPDVIFDVAKYGAKPDGVSDSTAAIQKAIDAAYDAKGGIVKFHAGDKPYLSGPLVVGDNINLQIDGGATLQLLPFSANATTPAYPVGARFITNNGPLQNFAVTGQGLIDGQGQEWWQAFRTNSIPGGARRPDLIRLSACDRVLVQGIQMLNSPMFHIAFSGSNVTIVGVSIQAPGNSPNTDATDPGGQHILIQNCYLSIGDDNVAVKAGSIYCADITIANLTLGEGHGVSVGGQSNRGLDGMVVKDCVFNGTTTGLRLKADATQGGPVANITYSNLTMKNVQYPIVFYSYYKNVGSPGSTTGTTATPPEKVLAWNATPPNWLGSRTLPSWSNITINNLTATGTTGYNIIWGLPLSGYLFANVTLHNVHSDGPGFGIYDASNVQITGNSDVGEVTTANTLAILKQPMSQSVRSGANATFSVTAAGTSGAKNAAPKYQWSFNGTPLADGTGVSGASSPTLTLKNVQAAQAGNYTVTVMNNLDGFDVNGGPLASDGSGYHDGALTPDSIPVSATSSAAVLAVQ